MNIIEGIRDYIGNMACMATFTTAINVNYLDSVINSFSIEEVPSEPIIKKYVGGKDKRQFQFVFCSREPYSNEILQNIENSSFYEDFANEIENKNNVDDLPIVDGIESSSIEVTSSAYTVSTEEDTSMYQINLNFKYRK